MERINRRFNGWSGWNGLTADLTDGTDICYYMKKIKYVKDEDALLVEISEDSIDYAEDYGQMIIHFSHKGSPVLLEIFDAKHFSFNLLDSVINEKEIVYAC